MPARREETAPPVRSLVAATTAIAATYIYFLIFAQFGFLKALAEAGGEKDSLVRPVMAVMGMAGIAGSVGLANFFQERHRRRQLMAGFIIAAAAAGLTWVARSPAVFYLCAALTGTGTGMVTVGLAAALRRETGGDRLGRCIGVGTGVAYAFCNLPPVFAAGAQVQAMLGLVAACTGLIAVQRFEQPVSCPPATGYDYNQVGIRLWTAGFLILVFLDSAAFYHIQQTPELRQGLWSGNTQLSLIAAVHLVAAGLAGLALDRRWVMGTAGLGAALLLAAIGFMGGGTAQAALKVTLYAAGVSLYSTVLVFYPARSGSVGLAAGVYSVAGWIGSALGISLTEYFGSIPGWLLGLCAGLMLTGFTLRQKEGRRPTAPVQ